MSSSQVRAWLDRALLSATDDTGSLQLIGQMGDTTDEGAVIARAVSAFLDLVDDRTPVLENLIDHA